ncbi:plasmid mobilization protein [Flavobacterium haoranii]|uniref:Mobilisation protein (MobC) n=1 Tax=Flavobacterium haoranii TaxID=683124 RepID=A0A1M6J6Z5_9FLAO|nr:plasmid mobilization relaxosome protein MobC [Flavobacterium haoranii]SHJ42451.1 mobilisation protein (MobC) [Flavobacterium haoranii]
MARPKSDVENLRVFQVNIRLTFDQQILIESLAQTYGLSVVEYVRKRALNKQLPKHALSPINRELLIELSRIGNNVNQLAKKSNQNFLDKYVFNRDLRELKEILNQIKTELLE